MSDLNVMIREQAMTGLQSALDVAVTNGDTVAARKISDDIAKLTVSTAPKAPPYGDAEVRAVLDKQEWFGTDPKRTAKALEFGKTMDLKKFATADALAAAIVKAVDVEFPPPAAAGADEETEEERGAREAEEAETAAAAAKKPPRRSDGPTEAEAGAAARAVRAGPWTKLSDAPADVQAAIKRQADKFVPAGAPKEQREGFVTRSLESHFQIHQQRKGKK